MSLQVRAARSIELLAQRRHFEAHTRAQTKAVHQQAASFDDSLHSLRADAAAWKAKLLNYERLLANAMSLKGIDICWREAQALRVKQGKQLAERVALLQGRITASCEAVVAGNREFEAANLKLFEGEKGTGAAVCHVCAVCASVYSPVRPARWQVFCCSSAMGAANRVLWPTMRVIVSQIASEGT